MTNQPDNPYAAPQGELWQEETIKKSLFWEVRRAILLPFIIAVFVALGSYYWITDRIYEVRNP